jgi:aryl carrier-like protein
LGNFANYPVLRTAPAPERSLREFVAQVHELVRQAREHAAVRVEWLAHQLYGSSAFPFQVVARVRRAPAFLVSGRPAREVARRSARTHGADIVVDVLLGADGPAVAVDVSQELTGHPALDDFVQTLRRRCEAWASAPDTPLVRREDGAHALFVRKAPADLRTTGLGGPARTPEEHALVDAIRQVLDLEEHDEIGREDTFFALGGDSVTALRLVTLLSAQGYSLDVQKVFEYPELHELAAQFGSSGTREAASEPPPAAPMSASGLDGAALASLGQKFSQR